MLEVEGRFSFLQVEIMRSSKCFSHKEAKWLMIQQVDGLTLCLGKYLFSSYPKMHLPVFKSYKRTPDRKSKTSFREG